MSNKLQFVAASQQRSNDRRNQPTKVCWTPENLVYAVLNHSVLNSDFGSAVSMQ